MWLDLAAGFLLEAGLAPDLEFDGLLLGFADRLLLGLVLGLAAGLLLGLVLGLAAGFVFGLV